jgi:hypothetical protein
VFVVSGPIISPPAPVQRGVVDVLFGRHSTPLPRVYQAWRAVAALAAAPIGSPCLGLCTHCDPIRCVFQQRTSVPDSFAASTVPSFASSLSQYLLRITGISQNCQVLRRRGSSMAGTAHH